MNNNFIRSNPNNNNKNRNRNRNNNNNRRNTGGGGNLGGGGSNKVFDSNGPDIKLRGTTQTIAEKYMQLGRDAQSSGDSVAAENYYQHAEHYYRMWAANQPVGQSLIMSRKLGEEEFEEEGSDENAEGDADGGNMEAGAEGNQSLEGGGIDPNASQGEAQQPRQNRNNNYRDNNTRDNTGRNFRPRWPNNNRNNRNYENRDGAEQTPAAASEGSAEIVAAPMPAPVAAEADGQWEAPSFLQRPTPAVVETPQVSEAVSEDAPPVRKPRARKPRVEVETPVDDGSNAPE